jgi:hypothetical protein
MKCSSNYLERLLVASLVPLRSVSSAQDFVWNVLSVRLSLEILLFLGTLLAFHKFQKRAQTTNNCFIQKRSFDSRVVLAGLSASFFIRIVRSLSSTYKYHENREEKHSNF